MDPSAHSIDLFRPIYAQFPREFPQPDIDQLTINIHHFRRLRGIGDRRPGHPAFLRRTFDCLSFSASARISVSM